MTQLSKGGTLLLIVTLLITTAVIGRDKKYNAFQVRVTGKGQPVILIPGATCSGDEWNETIAQLNGSCECHVLTLAGYAGIPPLQHEQYLQTMKNEIEEYIADKKLQNVSLIGHSIGGFLALWIATDGKSSVARVIVVDAMPYFAGAYNPNVKDTFSRAKAEEMLHASEKMNNEELMAKQIKTAKFMCNDSARWNQIATWGTRSDKKTVAYTVSEMMSNDLRDKISSIKIPVLVLAAYSSMPEYPMYTRESVSSVYSAQYKECSMCRINVATGGTRHFIMYDNPGWFYKETISFLKG